MRVDEDLREEGVQKVMTERLVCAATFEDETMGKVVALLVSTLAYQGALRRQTRLSILF